MNAVLEELVEQLKQLPGIGRKSAWRMVMHLIDQPHDRIEHLSNALMRLTTDIASCERCNNISSSQYCDICSDPRRQTATICVVEKPIDVLTIERIGFYRGMYHILGGVLSPINGITIEKLHIDSLLRRVEEEKPSEIILGLSASIDAETTLLYLSRILAKYPLKISRFARGLPSGIELEHIDQQTMTHALQQRIYIDHH